MPPQEATENITNSVALRNCSRRWITSSSLCPYCHDAQIDMEEDRCHRRTTSLSRLQSSDCEFCEILEHCIMESLPNFDVKKIGGISVDLFGSDKAKDFYGQNISIASSEWPTTYRFRICASPALPCPWGLVLCEDPMPLPSWIDNIKVACGWITTCVTQHAECNNNGLKPVKWPSRIVDLGASNDNIRLMETTHMEEQCAMYACLSHRWGEPEPLKTTRNTLASRCHNIAWAIIPKTHQDAIYVARLLRIRYLWIDSLCILQDDDEDWATESAAMADVYSNAFLTIAASSAASSATGLLTAGSLGVKYVSGINLQGRAYWYSIHTGKYPHPEDGSRLASLPLLNRGWVLQERLLSRRMLHIAPQELLWECNQSSQCQCGKLIAPYNSPKRACSDLKESTPRLQVIQSTWQIIESYSGLHLTISSDKLAAFSGLAKRILSIRRDAMYLAGLWSDSLVIDLLWQCRDDDTGSRRPRQWRAPSWSWASVDGTVLFPLSSYYRARVDEAAFDRVLESYAQIQSAHCNPATSDPTGKVKDGSIVISGYTWRGVWDFGEGSDTLHGLELQVSNDETESQPEGPNTVMRPRLSFLRYPAQSADGINMDDKRDLQDPTLLSTEVLCLRMARIGRHTPRPEEAEYALVLQRVGGGDKSYRRIGIVSLARNTHENPAAWDKRPSVFEIGGHWNTITMI